MAKDGEKAGSSKPGTEKGNEPQQPAERSKEGGRDALTGSAFEKRLDSLSNEKPRPTASSEPPPPAASGSQQQGQGGGSQQGQGGGSQEDQGGA